MTTIYMREWNLRNNALRNKPIETGRIRLVKLLGSDLDSF